MRVYPFVTVNPNSSQEGQAFAIRATLRLVEDMKFSIPPTAIRRSTSNYS